MTNLESQTTVTYRLTPDDVTEATRLHQARTAQGRFGIALVVLFFVWFAWELFSLATLPTGEDAAGLIGQCTFILVLIAIYCADQRFFLPRRARQAWRRVASLSEEIILRWNDSGLKIKTESSSLTLAWPQIWRRLENANLVLLYQSANAFVIIPKRAFAPALLARLNQNIAGAKSKELPFLKKRSKKLLRITSG